MKNIVALVDFSDVSAKVIEQSRQLTEAFGANLVILHGVQRRPVTVDVGIISPTVLMVPSEEEIQAEYNRLLDIGGLLKGSGIRASVEQLDPADPKTVIERCKRLGADIIVVGSHHHSALYELFVGTFTHDVLKQATCPVLVVPATN